MTFQWSAEFGGVLNEIRSEFGRSYAVMQKRARCNSRHCEEESVSMDNSSRGCTASGKHRWGSELLAGRLAGSMIWLLHLSL
jgi:hypothetical protein